MNRQININKYLRKSLQHNRDPNDQTKKRELSGAEEFWL